MSLTRRHLGRLEDGIYLDDELIEFGLKSVPPALDSEFIFNLPLNRLLLDDLRNKDPRLAENIHVFSSFFYPKLAGREEYYNTVRRWTKNIDIFSKTLIVIPIHEEYVPAITYLAALTD